MSVLSEPSQLKARRKTDDKEIGERLHGPELFLTRRVERPAIARAAKETNFYRQDSPIVKPRCPLFSHCSTRLTFHVIWRNSKSAGDPILSVSMMGTKADNSAAAPVLLGTKTLIC